MAPRPTRRTRAARRRCIFACLRHVDAARLLLDRGAPTFITATRKYNATALASSEGDIEIEHSSLDKRSADLDREDNDGEPPMAKVQGHTAVVDSTARQRPLVRIHNKRRDARGTGPAPPQLDMPQKCTRSSASPGATRSESRSRPSCR